MDDLHAFLFLSHKKDSLALFMDAILPIHLSKSPLPAHKQPNPGLSVSLFHTKSLFILSLTKTLFNAKSKLHLPTQQRPLTTSSPPRSPSAPQDPTPSLNLARTDQVSSKFPPTVFLAMDQRWERRGSHCLTLQEGCS